MECPPIVNQKVCVEAKVTVEPEAKVGDVHACCVDRPKFEECEKGPCGCTYMVSQMICVRFPLTISAAASARPAGMVCCKPSVGPCRNDDGLCVKQTAGGEGPTSCKPAPVLERTDMAGPLRGHGAVKEVFDIPKTKPIRKPVLRRCGFCFPPIFFPPFIRPRINNRNKRISF
jgi:hypothetical protein